MLNFRNYRTRKLIYEPRAFSARKRWSSLLFPRVTSRRCCNPGNDVTPRVESRCTRASFGMDTRVGWVCLGWDWEYVIVVMVIDMNALIDLNNYLRLICVWYLMKCHFFIHYSIIIRQWLKRIRNLFIHYILVFVMIIIISISFWDTSLDVWVDTVFTNILSLFANRDHLLFEIAPDQDWTYPLRTEGSRS